MKLAPVKKKFFCPCFLISAALRGVFLGPVTYIGMSLVSASRKRLFCPHCEECVAIAISTYKYHKRKRHKVRHKVLVIKSSFGIQPANIQPAKMSFQVKYHFRFLISGLKRLKMKNG